MAQVCQYEQTNMPYVSGTYLKRTCSRVTSASSTLGVHNDYVLLYSSYMCYWMILLVPAYPGCPGQTAVKWLLLLLLDTNPHTHSLTHRLRPWCWRWTARRRLNGRARWRQSPAARRTTEARGRSAGNVTEGDEGLHLRCTTSSRPEVPTSCTSLRPLPPAHDGATAGCLHIQPNQFPGDIHIHTHTRFGAQPVSASEPKLNIRLITTIITTTTLIERPLFHDKLGKPVPDR